MVHKWPFLWNFSKRNQIGRSLGAGSRAGSEFVLLQSSCALGVPVSLLGLPNITQRYTFNPRTWRCYLFIPRRNFLNRHFERRFLRINQLNRGFKLLFRDHHFLLLAVLLPNGRQRRQTLSSYSELLSNTLFYASFASRLTCQLSIPGQKFVIFWVYISPQLWGNYPIRKLDVVEEWGRKRERVGRRFVCRKSLF